ncbi:MAG: hypothetical protein IPM57_09460 [Oligoflexia bacterium]|nr:hypothetical protein [Oligoflexia bacterium]
MKYLLLAALVLVSFPAFSDEPTTTTEIMSCATHPKEPTGSYLRLEIFKDTSGFNVTVAAFNRTSRDVVETFIKAKVDSCEILRTNDEDGSYFNCYKINPKTGMKDFGISNVYVVENTIDTIKYNLPRKSYRIEVVASSEDTSIDRAMYKEIIGTQNFMHLANCQ